MTPKTHHAKMWGGGALKNTTFLTAVHRGSDIIKNVRTNFESSDTRLLNTKSDDENTKGKTMSNRRTRDSSGEKNPV